MEKCSEKQTSAQQPSNKVKWFRTVMVLCVMFFHCLGWYSFYSTIYDFVELLNTSVHTPAIGLSVRCIGSCIGCLAAAFTYKLGDKLMICSIFLIFEGIAIGFISNFSCVHTYFFFKFIIGYTAGSVKTGCILVLTDTWMEKSSPLIQTLDFVDLLASVASPISVQPFLSKVTHTANHTLELTYGDDTNYTSEIDEPFITEMKHESNIWLPLGTFGLLMNLTALVALVMYCFRQNSPNNENQAKTEKTDEQQKSDVVSEVKKDEREEKYKILTTAAICFAIFAYNIEVYAFFQHWTTFVMTSELKISKSTAIFMLSAFSLAMAVGSLIAIFLSIKVRAIKIIMGLIILRILGNIALVFENELLLWIGGILMCAGFGPFNATLFNSLKERVMVTNLIGSLVTFSQFISAAAAFPLLIGYLMQSSPFVLIYSNFGIISLLTVVFVIVFMLDHWRHAKKQEDTKI